LLVKAQCLFAEFVAAAITSVVAFCKLSHKLCKWFYCWSGVNSVASGTINVCIWVSAVAVVLDVIAKYFSVFVQDFSVLSSNLN